MARPLKTPVRCAGPSCERDAIARGFCLTHYWRDRRGWRMDAPMPPAVKCAADGCDRTAEFSSLCDRHRRMKKRNEPRASAPAPVVKCVVCSLRVSPLHPSFCLEHASAWLGSPEQKTVCDWLLVLSSSGVANPRFGPALDALISAAIETFAARVRASTPEAA